VLSVIGKFSTAGDAIIRQDGSAGKIFLNRPQVIDALNAEMPDAMTTALLAWRDDPAVKVAILDHAEGRGFCAGGDVNLVRQSALTDGGAARRKFFYEEY
jgi:enoyl-CoA hydratase